jgi:3-dehydroquinate dehydratase/shikimate dehydrogenase
VPSRFLGARLGMPFTYAAFSKDFRIAPGIPCYDDLKSIYDYDRINAQTQVYGVIGDPVAHSLSPLIHNAAFRQLGIDAVYLPFRVPRSTLGSFLREFDKLGVRGYSVTIPHKESAALLATRKEDAVTATGSANTLIRIEDGFAAANTDYQASVDSLKTCLPPGGKLEQKQVLLLGAGGVARALAHALSQAGAAVCITNRTTERAQKLAAEIGGRAVEWGHRLQTPCDVLVNCTSVGMHPDVDDSPMHAGYFKPGMIVMDTVYTPENTLLIKEARARGCIVRTGVDMFVRQAARQFQLFTGQEPPLDLMHKLVKRALSPVTLREE